MLADSNTDRYGQVIERADLLSKTNEEFTKKVKYNHEAKGGLIDMRKIGLFK